MCVGEGANVYGEEYKKEGEEIVFVCVVVVQKQESDRELEKHSVFFATRPVPEPAFRAFLSHNPRVVTGHRQLGRWSGFRRGRWWRCP